MRQATCDDYTTVNAILDRNGQAPLSGSDMDALLIFIGDHGHFILDPQDSTTAILHATIDKSARGKWAASFMRAFLRWAFTYTRIERINTSFPISLRSVKRFGIESGFHVTRETNQNVFMSIDILKWLSICDDCLEQGAHAESDFAMADNEMVKRVAGACSMMHESGMEHKAWYLYQLYAKLFGYRAEV